MNHHFRYTYTSLSASYSEHLIAHNPHLGQGQGQNQYQRHTQISNDRARVIHRSASRVVTASDKQNCPLFR